MSIQAIENLKQQRRSDRTAAIEEYRKLVIKLGDEKSVGEAEIESVLSAADAKIDQLETHVQRYQERKDRKAEFEANDYASIAAAARKKYTDSVHEIEDLTQQIRSIEKTITEVRNRSKVEHKELQEANYDAKHAPLQYEEFMEESSGDGDDPHDPANFRL